MERTSAAGEGRGRIPEAAEEPVPPFEVLLRACTMSAVHLEMRDSYTPSDPWFRAWLAGDREEFERRLSRPWLGLIREVTGRGVQVRRARVISEPVTELYPLRARHHQLQCRGWRASRLAAPPAGVGAATAGQRLLGLRRPAGAVQLFLRRRGFRSARRAIR